VGTNSVAVAAATSSGDRFGSSLDGHDDGVMSQSGPCCHSFEDTNTWTVVSLDKRSAGFARMGQYLQSAFGTLVEFLPHGSVQRWVITLCSQSNAAQSGYRTT